MTSRSLAKTKDWLYVAVAVLSLCSLSALGVTYGRDKQRLEQVERDIQSVEADMTNMRKDIVSRLQYITDQLDKVRDRQITDRN